MQVADLAKQLNTSSDVVLRTLKSLRLKAKDGKQELSTAVISVVRSEFLKTAKISPAVVEKAPSPKVRQCGTAYSG